MLADIDQDNLSATEAILTRKFDKRPTLIGCAIALLGQEPDFTFDVCGITEFYWVGDRWECTLANDQSHLSDPGVKVAQY